MEFITYEMFGAVGDGVTDDMPAIAKAHAEANKCNKPVRAKAGATYYISPKALTAVIKTNVDWTGAKFIIDDVDCEDRRAAVFKVVSNEEPLPFTITSLEIGQAAIDNPYNRDLFLIVKNENHRDYIRRGLNQNNGAPRTDNFILLADGTLPSPVSFEFTKVTSVTALPMDTEKLILKGGEFLTIANQGPIRYDYHYRNILIKRSNVEVDGITHLITGELDHGSPYNGFLQIAECANIYVHDCVFTGHKIYKFLMENGQWNHMGTYDILIGNAASVTLARCTQTTDIKNRDYWGLMGSNFCRDLTLEDCHFSRFDAHQGVTNCTLRRCTLGWQCINAIGNGTFTIEEVTAYGHTFVNLRDDYGSHWKGDMIIKNAIWHPAVARKSFFVADNDGMHNFGYDCYLPQNITIDGLTLVDEEGTDPLYIFNDYSGDPSIPAEDRKYLPVPPVSVSIKNANTSRPIELCQNPKLMPGTAFIVKQ